MKPFDGARRNKPDIDGKLAFWDKFYNTQSNTVLIGFDSDQANNNFRGFTLKWTSQKIAALNFRDVEYALNYVRKNLIKRVMNEEFVDNGASVMSRSINSLVRNANKAIYDANRPRRCTRDKSEQVSGMSIEKFNEIRNFTPKSTIFSNSQIFQRWSKSRHGRKWPIIGNFYLLFGRRTILATNLGNRPFWRINGIPTSFWTDHGHFYIDQFCIGPFFTHFPPRFIFTTANFDLFFRWN